MNIHHYIVLPAAGNCLLAKPCLIQGKIQHLALADCPANIL